MRRLLPLLAALAVLLAPLAVAAPASSSAFPWKAVVTFDKNWHSPASSKVTWSLYERAGATWKLTETHSWRAGSGMLGRRGTNSCIHNTGWLPDGTYRMKLYDDYPGNLIQGRAFRLDDKRCGNGTLRNDLFLHTEQGHGNRQCANRPGDQPCRWEYPAYNDYKSYGCVKMAPGDLAQLVALFRQHFSAGVRYPSDRISLHVVP